MLEIRRNNVHYVCQHLYNYLLFSCPEIIKLGPCFCELEKREVGRSAAKIRGKKREEAKCFGEEKNPPYESVL